MRCVSEDAEGFLFKFLLFMVLFICYNLNLWWTDNKVQGLIEHVKSYETTYEEAIDWGV